MLFKLMVDSEHVQRFEFRALGPLSRFFWAVDQFRHHDGPTNLVVENEKCRTRAPYYSIIDGRVSHRKSPPELNMGHTISLDNYTTLPGGSPELHTLFPPASHWGPWRPGRRFD